MRPPTTPARRTARAIILCLLCLLTACAGPSQPRVIVGARVEADGGAVACVERSAARAGADALAAGGNAVDAAVATALALAVTWPPAGNLGGGGLATVVLPDGTEEVIDFRETAPAAVTPQHFLDAQGLYDPALADHPWRNVGVPGSVAGLHLMHARHGRLPWAELVAPAAALARDGFVVDAMLAQFLASFDEQLARGAPGLRGADGPLLAGQVLRQPELAQTLDDLAARGPVSFYEGPRAQALAAAAQAGGGFLSAEDLSGYRAVVREPLAHSLPEAWGGQRVLAPPPPSAGGVTLAMVDGLLARLEWERLPPGSADAIHLWVEASRRAFAERARWLGDPLGMDVTIDLLLSPTVLDAMARSGIGREATPSEELGPPVSQREPEQTTHLSVIDAEGGAVSLTTTLESAFGAKVMAPGSGVLLNNQLRDFNRWPGMTTRDGLVGTTPNLALPGRRPLSSVAPVVVLDADGAPLLVTGSPGGRTIPSTVGRLLLAVLVHDVSLDQAVAAPRLHHGWFPDRIDAEPDRFDDTLLRALRARGHEVHERPAVPPLFGTQGAAHSVAREQDGDLLAVGDARRDGWAAGVDL